MKAIITLVLATIFAGQISLPAQQPDKQPPLEAVSPAATEPAVETEPALVKKWREEVLAWKDAQRVEKGTTSQAIESLNRSVLILGTVNGDVSTVSGDIAVLGNVNGNVSATSGTITVLGAVNGEAKTVSGNLRVGGKITGATSAIGGKIETAPGAQLLGPSNSSIHGNWDINLGNTSGSFKLEPGSYPSIYAFWLSPFMLLWRSGLLIFWVAMSCAMAALFQPAILRAKAELQRAPAQSAALGFLWTILFWVLLVAFIFLSLMLIGVPLLIVLVAFDIALGVFGMTLVFAVVGERLAHRLNHPNVSIYAAVFVGACFLGLLRLIPIVGSLIWFAAGLFGVGATLSTRFGAAETPPTTGPAAAQLAVPA
jgi:cytoskeletal protein CcmA (bactofilin family)